MNYSILILLASACVAVMALLQIASVNRELTAFRRGIKSLPDGSFPAGPMFQGRYESCRLASEFLGVCSYAAQRQMLGVLNVERAAAPVINYFRTRVNTPRSLAGVLVLCGLLVTLLNLQGSVGTLGESFQNLSANQKAISETVAARSVKEIQSAMGEIAGRAHDAFLQSFGVILLAAIILLLTLLLNNRAQSTCRNLTVWANATHIRGLVDRPPVQETQVEKLNELIGKLSEVAGSIEGMGPAMASVGDLGAKLDASSQIVADAVKKLPDTINASVGQLSVEVTRDISVHLQHQIEHLKKILAIYGDQELRVKKVQEYLEKMGDATEKAMTGLIGLSVLPAKIDSLSAAVQTFNGRAAEMGTACSALDKKIDQIPVIDHARIEGLAGLVKDVSRELREFAKDAPGLISGPVNVKLDGLAITMQTLAGRDPAAAIRELSDEFKGLQKGLSGFQSEKMEQLATHLERLMHERRSGFFGMFGRS